MGASAPPPLLAALLLVLLSAATASASTQQQQQQDIARNTFLRSPRFWPRLLQHKILPPWGAFGETDQPPEAEVSRSDLAATTTGTKQKPLRRPKPNPPGGAVPKPPGGHKPPPPGLGPKPPPLGLGATCSGRITEQCVIPAGAKVNITSSLAVRSMIVYGEVQVIPPSGTANLVINSSFILVRGKQAKFSVSGTAWNRTVTIYLRRDPTAYADVPVDTDDMLGGGRVLAAWQGAQILLDGLPLQRTWTLLTQDVNKGADKICVSDSVDDWPVGRTIAIVPSDDVHDIFPSSLAVRVGAQVFTINAVDAAAGTECCRSDSPSSCSGARITLNGSVLQTPNTANDSRPFVPQYHGTISPVQAEVLMLDRTILITGDDFSRRYKPNPPPPWKNPAAGSGGIWPTPWSNWSNSPYPTEGLHVLAAGLCDDGGVNGKNCQSNGGFLKARYVRVEKGGQRGFIGRYPLHFHKMGDCPECEFTGNAVVNSQQRGIVIHSTHRSTVMRNVVFGVKGAFIYVEEGVEIGNTIQENALACDVGIASYTAFVNDTWVDAGLAAPASDDGGAGKVRDGGGYCQVSSEADFGDPSIQLGGCRIQGTDNEQADCVQQAGIWSLSVSNNFIGNRVSNMYNGIYFQSTLFSGGRLGTDSEGRVCPLHSNWGVMKGNVVHSNQRFGWYPDVNYPNAVDRSVESNGYVTDLVDNTQCTGDLTDFSKAAVCSCRPYTFPNGDPNGQQAVTYEDGIDWGNGFVGQYDLADVQYKNFTSINNNLGMYWKGSRNFRTIGTAHIKDSTFSFSTRGPQIDPACCKTPPCFPPTPQLLLSYWSYAGDEATSLVQLPGASATMILENVRLLGSPNHADWLPPQPDYLDPSGSGTWMPGSWGPKEYHYSTGTGQRNPGQGAALTINQQCKFFKGFKNPLGELGYDEGALCTPQVYLVNVTFNLLECPEALAPSGTDIFTQQPFLPVWVNIGAANGNSYLGMVLAADDSLCGGLVTPCPVRAIVSNYSTHLLDLPGNPCFVPDWFNATALWGPAWYRRFNGHMICTKQTRRLNIWGPEQDSPMLLMPPNGKRPWEMHWLGFGVLPDKHGIGGCWGSQCAKQEERRWAEGYGATVMSNEELPGVWTLKRMDGQPVDLTKVRYIEFSDQVFGQRFQPVDTMQLQIDGHPVCTLKSTDSRAWMTQFGPARRGGGSCLNLLEQYPMPSR